MTTYARFELLKDVARMVVKLGTGVLTDSRKQPDLAQMEQLVTQVVGQRQAGREVVLVSSGAVGAGMECWGTRSGRSIWRSCRLARPWASHGLWRFTKSSSARMAWRLRRSY